MENKRGALTELQLPSPRTNCHVTLGTRLKLDRSLSVLMVHHTAAKVTLIVLLGSRSIIRWKLDIRAQIAYLMYSVEKCEWCHVYSISFSLFQVELLSYRHGLMRQIGSNMLACFFLIIDRKPSFEQCKKGKSQDMGAGLHCARCYTLNFFLDTPSVDCEWYSRRSVKLLKTRKEIIQKCLRGERVVKIRIKQKTHETKCVVYAAPVTMLRASGR